MNTYRVVLSRTYVVNVNAETVEKAKDVAEFFTSHITDISNEKDRKKESFSIVDIECMLNEALEAQEVWVATF